MSKKYILLFLVIAVLCGQDLIGQNGYHFGTKGGISIGNQNWNGAERSPLFSYHINGFIESRDPNLRGSLYAQFGLHTRGSGLGVIFNSNSRNSYRFRNLSLLVGFKKVLDKEVLSANPYYFMGIRGEYTVSNNMREIQEFFINVFNANPTNTIPSFITAEPAFVNQWLYGISIGGGFQFYGSEFFNTALEFTLSPDINFQYNRLPGQISGQDALQIRNVTFEISLVFRFLREIIYED